MRILVIGSAPDVRGFALAGIGGRVAADAESGRRELAAARAARDVGLVLLSEPLARQLTAELRALAAAGPAPVALVLPGNGR